MPQQFHTCLALVLCKRWHPAAGSLTSLGEDLQPAWHALVAQQVRSVLLRGLKQLAEHAGQLQDEVLCVSVLRSN